MNKMTRKAALEDGLRRVPVRRGSLGRPCTGMVRRRVTGHLAVCIALVCSLVPGQVPAPGISLVQSFSVGSLGIPGQLGGIEFSTDGTALYVATTAASAAGSIRVLTVQRDPVTNRVTGLSAPVTLTAAPNIDGGLQFGPNGVLFWTTNPTHTLGQYAPGAPPTVFSLGPVGVPASAGGLEFVPPGLPNAGDLLVSSAWGGGIHRISLSPNPNGTFTPVAGSAVLFAQIPGGIEAMRHIPSGSNAGDMLFCDWCANAVYRLAIDPATGWPLAGPGGQPIVTPVITGMLGAEGMAFDPLTDDLFVGTWTYSGNDAIHHFTGLGALSLSAAQPGGPGTALYVGNTNLTPGAEYHNLVSFSTCPGGPGTGPGPFGSCLTPAAINFLMDQLNWPVGTVPFHFVAPTDYVVWPPLTGLPPLTVDALCIEMTSGVPGAVSPMVRIVVQ